MSSLTQRFTESPALVTALFLGVIVVLVIARVRSALRWRRWGSFRRPRRGDRPLGSFQELAGANPKLVAAARPSTDSADQLRIVMSANFSPQPLLNRGEARVFRELEAIVKCCNPRWLVMAQVSLGEILRSPDGEAYSCINSKRVDLLLVDEDCQPRHVLEYQGAGHHQKDAAARDAVKKEALRRAGIGYHEVIAGQTTPSELKRLVTKLVESGASNTTSVL